MLRNIITIDEEKCDGCGDCVTGCVEGALQIIDGKARLISEMYCDGLGACIGNCHVNAISVVQKECEAYDEIKTLHNIMPHGRATVIAHLKHLLKHGELKYLDIGLEYLKNTDLAITKEELIEPKTPSEPKTVQAVTAKASSCGCSDMSCSDDAEESNLTNWPIQMHLVNPMSDMFAGKDILIAADCVPFAFRNFHEVFLKDKPVIIACPKLDSNKESYYNKLITLLTDNPVNSLTVVVMEVPCCSGLVHLVKQAIDHSGSDVPFTYKVVGIEGTLLN